MEIIKSKLKNEDTEKTEKVDWVDWMEKDEFDDFPELKKPKKSFNNFKTTVLTLWPLFLIMLLLFVACFISFCILIVKKCLKCGGTKKEGEDIEMLNVKKDEKTAKEIEKKMKSVQNVKKEEKDVREKEKKMKSVQKGKKNTKENEKKMKSRQKEETKIPDQPKYEAPVLEKKISPVSPPPQLPSKGLPPPPPPPPPPPADLFVIPDMAKLLQEEVRARKEANKNKSNDTPTISNQAMLIQQEIKARKEANKNKVANSDESSTSKPKVVKNLSGNDNLFSEMRRHKSFRNLNRNID